MRSAFLRRPPRILTFGGGSRACHGTSAWRHRCAMVCAASAATSIAACSDASAATAHSARGMCGGFGIERTRMSRSMGRGRAWDGVWEALHMLREMGCMLIRRWQSTSLFGGMARGGTLSTTAWNAARSTSRWRRCRDDEAGLHISLSISLSIYIYGLP